MTGAVRGKIFLFFPKKTLDKYAHGIKAEPVREKCVICGREFDVSGRRTKTCSTGCAREHVKKLKIKWEAEHRKERNAYHRGRRSGSAET